MNGSNPFPESPEKAHLRRLHLARLAKHKQEIGRDLSYLGLPSAEMLDVRVWRPVLGQITAIERDRNVAAAMYRTAQMLEIRDRTIIVEDDLYQVARILAMEDTDARRRIAEMLPSEREKYGKIREIPYDVINLDLCGGFLYLRDDGSSENADTLKYIIDHQGRNSCPFFLILTFNLRDTGRDDYVRFISETLDGLDTFEFDTRALRNYYLADEHEGQPPNLRRLRFCVPIFLLRAAFERFNVSSLGAWYYKTFYHSALYFEPRPQGALGTTWPPIPQFKALLNATLHRVQVIDDEPVLSPLEAPAFS
jgi:hypothetical protein